MKALLKYPGAKNRVAPWICEHIPEHKVYCEPFAGSLAVFFNKERSHIETVNDIHDEVVNYFWVLRDHPEELRQAISNTPFSRSEYINSYEMANSDLERARRFCVRCWMGFGCSNRYRNGFKTGQQSTSPNPAKIWAELPDRMTLAAERLRGVQIENLPAMEIIRRYDTADVFFYIDPPYLKNTRKGYLYKYEMTDLEHEDLLKALVSHPGKILVSGYDNEMYNRFLKGWKKDFKKTQAEHGIQRTECLWMNYET